MRNRTKIIAVMVADGRAAALAGEAMPSSVSAGNGIFSGRNGMSL